MRKNEDKQKAVGRLALTSWLTFRRAPGEEPFGRVGLSEARTDQLTLDHVPGGTVGVADDFFFADDFVSLW